MRKPLFALLLAALATAASAQRIALDVPLSPSPTGLTGAAAISPLAQTFPVSLSPWTPAFAAMTPNIPLNAKPIVVKTLSAAAITPAVHSLAPSALTPMKIAPNTGDVPGDAKALPKVIDSLREHGAKSGQAAGLDGETGKTALESNFMSAASLDSNIPPDENGRGEHKKTPTDDTRPLLARMLDKVRLDDRGRTDEKKALEDAFKRMLATPTGRRYAEEFLAEGLTAVVHFEDFADSQLFLVDGRKKFYAAQAYTDWKQEGYAEIRLNRHYVDGDPDFLRDSLPSIIGHELLGHGLWYGRAAKENLYLAFHYHELNETLARLVGWSIDHEMDGRFEEQGAWTYLSDPANYLALLKMRLAYYAVTFSKDEMSKPMETLQGRLAAAQQEVIRAQKNLAAQKTWTPVLDHFSRDHGIPAERFTLLRKELADLETHYQNEIVNAETIVREVSGLISRMNAEADNASINYLSQASQHPFFSRLSDDTNRLGAELTKAVSNAPKAEPRAAVPRPAGQISWEELAKMYQDDVAADGGRIIKHWR